jgi:hypothetical protein
MNTKYLNNKQRISQRKKDANDKQWYKDQANLLDTKSFNGTNFMAFSGLSEYKRKKVNYDLFNNIIDIQDFTYVCQPFGSEVGDLPANFTNRDIVSGKIKVLMGMEMKMPFSWKVVAVNEDATTRREQKETELLKEFVTSQVMRPIREQIEAQVMAQTKGRKLTPEEEQQLKQQIEEETKAQTPEEVRKYMVRDHQDPAEAMTHQILEYLILKEKVAEKFNKGCKHSLIAGEEIYWVGILNGEPCLKVINPLFFDYDKSPDLDYIEDGEWAVYEYRLSPSEVVASFGSELSEDDIDKIYTYHHNPGAALRDAEFTFNEDYNDPYTIRVVHATWKSLRKTGFLTYLDKNNREQMKLVDENYKFNEMAGDITLEWEWLPEAHECYKIMSDIFVYARAIPGQHKDLDNLYVCKLPYCGATTDNLNSPVTSAMDRMKGYQYFYDVILYRVELMMASDKGKKLAMNLNSIPKSAGIDINKWTYFFEANSIAWLNPNEEGNRGGGDVTNMVKEIDMSLASSIDQYIKFAEYIEHKCGTSIGVTPQMEAQIGPNEAVSNTRQNLVQSSHIIQPYFELHNSVKGNVLERLVETAKVAYAGSKPRKLVYILDDMTYKMITIDPELLDSSTYGLFISNSSKAADAKRAVEGLAQAAMQNQQADLADIIKVIRSESVTEAEDLLEVAQIRKSEEAQASEQRRIEAEQQARQAISAEKQIDREHEINVIITKEKERRKTVIQQQAILSMGFNEDKDMDQDTVPDVLEVAKYGVDAEIRQREQSLKEEQFRHQKNVDKEKLKIEDKKASKQLAPAK